MVRRRRALTSLAADVCAEIGALPDEAYVRYEAARHALAEGMRVDAEAQLARSLAFFRRAGASSYCQRAEELLDARPPS